MRLPSLCNTPSLWLSVVDTGHTHTHTRHTVRTRNKNHTDNRFIYRRAVFASLSLSLWSFAENPFVFYILPAALLEARNFSSSTRMLAKCDMSPKSRKMFIIVPCCLLLHTAAVAKLSLRAAGRRSFVEFLRRENKRFALSTRRSLELFPSPSPSQWSTRAPSPRYKLPSPSLPSRSSVGLSKSRKNRLRHSSCGGIPPPYYAFSKKAPSRRRRRRGMRHPEAHKQLFALHIGVEGWLRSLLSLGWEPGWRPPLPAPRPVRPCRCANCKQGLGAEKSSDPLFFFFE